jgi:hypothetical protein
VLAVAVIALGAPALAARRPRHAVWLHAGGLFAAMGAALALRTLGAP